jgi:hypothetical protein
MISYLNKKNIHLILSAVILIPASLLYGLYPEQVFPRLFEVDIEGVDLRNIFRAIMFLYLGMANILILGVLKSEYWKFATLLVIVFMGSLALGRTMSFFLDGSPSLIFILGLFGEFILAIFGYWQFRRYGVRV